MKRRKRSAKKKPLSKKTMAKLERLKELLEASKKLEAQAQEKAVTLAPEPSPPQEEAHESNPLKARDRPKSLERYSLGEIFLMEADGLLTDEELQWFRKKSGRFISRGCVTSYDWMN